MIVTSSNLAITCCSTSWASGPRAIAARLHVSGIDLRRGVEDEVGVGSRHQQPRDRRRTCAKRCAWSQKAISADASKAMLDILHQQRFRNGIPAGLRRMRASP